MIVISHEEIESLKITPEEYLKWIEVSISEKKTAVLPPKISLKPEEGQFYNFMPSILPKQKVSGIKVVNRYPNRVPTLDSQILLYNLETGKNVAILDGNLITTMRTGAVAAHSILKLEKEATCVYSFIGLGNQARSTAYVLSSVLKNKAITFKLLRYKDQHVKFADFLKKYYSDEVTIIFVDTYEEAIRGSDVVISSVTYFDQDIVDDLSWFNEGVLLVPIHTRGFLNCDRYFDKIFADDKGHVEGFKYFSEFKHFSEVSDILEDNEKGRANNSEKIIAYNIGLGIHDLFFANKIFKKFTLTEKKEEINLNNIMDKYYL
ncbi:MAG: ornithine cyclodeaminase [Bacilli bacterium]